MFKLCLVKGAGGGMPLVEEVQSTWNCSLSKREVLQIGVPFRVLFWMPYYIGGPKRDTDLENYPKSTHVLLYRLKTKGGGASPSFFVWAPPRPKVA